MSINLPTVSVLLPVHNGADTLPQALHSLSTQTLTDFEILAVDDGSTDGTPDVLAAFQNHDPRLRILPLPRSGLVPALNAGLAQAQGRYIARMDADDICHPDRLRLQTRYLSDNPGTGLVACRVGFGGNKEQAAGYSHYVDWTNTLLSHQDISLARFRESPLAHPSVMFRRTLTTPRGDTQIGYAEGPFPEDYELWLRWLEQGVRMAKLPQTLLTWNDPPGRLSRTHPNYGPKRFYETKARYLARWLSRHNPHHPDVHIMGAGRISRKRADMLLNHGIRIIAYADIDPRKIGHVVHGRPVLHRNDLPGPEHCFALSYVGSRGAAEDIRAFLQSRGFAEGLSFLLAA